MCPDWQQRNKREFFATVTNKGTVLWSNHLRRGANTFVQTVLRFIVDFQNADNQNVTIKMSPSLA
jgi:hypothetical protein